MSQDSSKSSSREQRLEVVLAECLREIEAGRTIHLAAWQERHPDLANELASFVANRAALERIAEPLKASAIEPTVGLASSDQPSDTNRVRYFGDYELLEELGRGGMGVVYKARQSTLNRHVALKMILSGELASRDDVQRFRQEAEAAANLDHPHIAPIYETGEHNGQQYFSMKLIAGRSLREAWDEGTLTRLATGVRLLAIVARAVHHAHQRGVLHRDLKPGNILLDNEGTPYVTDFGLAKRVEGGSDVTRTGAIVGTPSYMAPEQARAEKVLTTAVDVYSLGAMLYELLTGQPPFREDSPVKTLLKSLSSEPVRPRTLNPQADRDLETIAMKCLEKDAAERYDSAAALADDLDRWLRGEPIVARPASAWERAAKWARRRPASAALAVVSAAAVVLVVVGLAWEANRERVRTAAERSLRMRAENAEQEERRSAEQARTAEATSRERLVQLHVRDGLLHMDQGDLPSALLWFTEALAADVGEATREPAHRRRIANVLRAMPTLKHVEFPAGTVHLASNGQRVATVDGKTARVWEAATGKPLTPPLEHAEIVLSARFSPTGNLLATTTQYSVDIWDVERGERAIPSQPVDEGVYVCANGFSDDEQRFVTATGYTARLWNAKSHEPIGEPLKTKDLVEHILFSPSGRFVVTAGQRDIRLLHGQTFEPLAPPFACEFSFRTAQFSRDEKRLLVSSGHREGGTIQVLDLATGKLVGKPIVWEMGLLDFSTFADATGEHVVTDQAVHAVATGKPVPLADWKSTYVLSAVPDPTGKRLAVGDVNGTARVWDIAKKRPLTPPLVHGWPVNQLAWIGDALLTTGGPEVRIWNVGRTLVPVQGDAGSGRSARPTAVLHHREPVVRAAATSDGRTLVIATGPDHLARQWQVWELNDDHLPAAPQKSDRAGHALDPNGEFVMAASGSDGSAVVEFIRVADRQVRSRWTMDHVPFAAEFSRSGRWLLTQSEQRRQTGGQFLEVVRFVHVWDWEQGKAVGPPLRLEGAAIPRYTLFHPDGSQVITLGGPTAWTFWDVRTGVATSPPPITAGTDLTLFTDDGSRLLTHGERQVRLWNSRTWKLERKLDLEVDANNMVHADFSSDGRRAVVFRDGLFTVIDVASGATQFSIPELGGAVGSIQFTPDGSRLVTVMQDGEQRSAAMQLRFWDGRTGRPIGPARRFTHGINLRGFTPSGDLVVLSQESQIHVWDTASGTPVGPPLEHVPSPYKFAFRPDGSVLVTAANDATTKVHDLRPDPRPADELLRRVQLLTGQRIDPTGSFVPLSREELQTIWNELKVGQLLFQRTVSSGDEKKDQR